MSRKEAFGLVDRYLVSPPRPEPVDLDNPGPPAPEEDCGVVYWFFCPGCNGGHSFRTKLHKGQDPKTPLWTFNGDVNNPTFDPSLLINKNDPKIRCHLFLRNGILQFCTDSFHALKGQHVPLQRIT